MADEVAFIAKLKKENPGYTEFGFKGTCHDCRKDFELVINLDPLEIVTGGGFYYIESMEKIFLKCPECHRQDPILRNFQPCEVWSRVVGYLRPTRQWNAGKIAEFRERVNYDVGKITDAECQETAGVVDQETAKPTGEASPIRAEQIVPPEGPVL